MIADPRAVPPTRFSSNCLMNLPTKSAPRIFSKSRFILANRRSHQYKASLAIEEGTMRRITTHAEKSVAGKSLKALPPYFERSGFQNNMVLQALEERFREQYGDEYTNF